MNLHQAAGRFSQRLLGADDEESVRVDAVAVQVIDDRAGAAGGELTVIGLLCVGGGAGNKDSQLFGLVRLEPARQVVQPLAAVGRQSRAVLFEGDVRLIAGGVRGGVVLQARIALSQRAEGGRDLGADLG